MRVLRLEGRAGVQIVTVDDVTAKAGDFAARQKKTGGWEVGIADAKPGWMKVRSFIDDQGEQSEEFTDAQAPILQG